MKPEDEPTNPGTPDAFATLREVHAGVLELLRRFEARDAHERRRDAEIRDIHRRLDNLEAEAAE